MSRAPLLEATGLTRRFGGVSALESLDLEVWPGEILGLIGPNGSGKTTFFNVATGIYPATAGRVTFGGAEITGLSPQRVYRAGIARTFQRSRLCLPLSIFDNVMVGNHGRLNHGLGFNLFRRAAFRRGVRSQLRRRPRAGRALRPAARRSHVRRGRQHPDDRSAADRDLPGPDQPAQAAAAGRAVRRHDPRGDRAS